MQHNDIRNSLCYGCICFEKDEITSKYICLENNIPLRVGKHKVPQKHQSCKGPHDDISTVAFAFDEFNQTTPEERAALYNALEHGKIDKKGLNMPVYGKDKVGTTRFSYGP